MLSEISVICFAGSYFLALVLEISRHFFRSTIRGLAMIGCAVAGLSANTIFLYYHAIAPEGYPITSQQDMFFVTAWILAAVYVYLTIYKSKTPFGLYLLPIVLGLIGAGYFWADPTPFENRTARSVWGCIHGLSQFMAVVILAIGFVSGLMYLAKSRQLKSKKPSTGSLQLPSLEWLQRDNERVLVLATLMIGLGVLSGVMLNRMIYRESADSVPWYDPVVLGTTAMFVWLVVSLLVAVFYRPVREGHKVAWQTVACFIVLIAILIGGLMLDTRHWRIESDVETSQVEEQTGSPVELQLDGSPQTMAGGQQ